MSQKIVCDSDADGFEIVRELNRNMSCAVCGKTGRKIIDTQRKVKSSAKAVQVQKDPKVVQAENQKAFLAKLQAKENAQSMDLKIPRDWVIVNYGIPGTAGNLRYRLSRELRDVYGLVSRDLGGSFYVGPGSPELDAKLVEYVQKLKSVLGNGSWINVIRDTFNEENATIFKDAAIEGALAEMNHVETSVEQLERVLVGDEVIKDKDGKVRKVESFGPGRIRSAIKSLEAMDTALQRFQGNEALERAADRIKLRVKEVRAYVATVDKSLTGRIARAQTKGSGIGA